MNCVKLVDKSNYTGRKLLERVESRLADFISAGAAAGPKAAADLITGTNNGGQKQIEEEVQRLTEELEGAKVVLEEGQKLVTQLDPDGATTIAEKQLRLGVER